MHSGDGIKDVVYSEMQRVGVLADGLAQLVGEHVEQDFAVRLGVYMAQVLGIDLLVQLGGVGEIAVVCQHDAKGGADVKGLGFGGAACVACGGITNVGDAGVAVQIAHVAGAEHFAHHAFAFVHMKIAVLRGYDAGRVLPAVLQHLQAVIQKLVYGFV
ncbi:hypothetical protein GCWU000324_00634 [Kingella oralis ATCC 51147]|uniref:Uncharacterized protein n=1 Tax=Kingella oralis ATCC 51147 TaxID=629741 RepID=C4GES7_9NEIS|nr:hypothetical protein GCWU000324_00634 [Kingella oralis ATCC 51147]